MSQTDLLLNLRVASPCHESWDRMTGDERLRFCDSCNLHVYNFSEMTSDEITSLVTRTEGRVCGRLYRRTDGTILTRDCPVGIKAFRKKISRVASATFATLLSGASLVVGQNPKKEQCKQIPAVTLERKKSDKIESPVFTGTVFDPNDAVIVKAKVVLLDTSGHPVGSTETNDSGEFSFNGVPDGSYSLEVSSPGFKQLVIKEIALHADEIATGKVVLDVTAATMGLMILSPSAVESKSGTTVIRGDFIRKLPINE